MIRLTVTVFDTRVLQHRKPSFTDVAKRIATARYRIQKVRYNLNSIDLLLDEMLDTIEELEEVTKHE